MRFQAPFCCIKPAWHWNRQYILMRRRLDDYEWEQQWTSIDTSKQYNNHKILKIKKYYKYSRNPKDL